MGSQPCNPEKSHTTLYPAVYATRFPGWPAVTNGRYLSEHNISGIGFDLDCLAPELRAFGEDQAAESLVTIDDKTHAKISRLALKNILAERMFVDKAICLAAVQVFEGSRRPLRRKRRFYSRKKPLDDE